MNKTESVRNWLILLVILIATGLVTAVLPLLNLNLDLTIGAGPTRPPVEESALVVPVPSLLATAFGSEIVLSRVQVVGVFVGLIIFVLVSIVVVGFILSFLIRLLSNSATAVAADETYQTNAAALEKREQEKLKNLRESHAKPNSPEAYVYSLDAISLSLIILLFVGLIGTMIFSEWGPLNLFGLTIDSRLSILIILFVLTIPLLAWRVRKQRLLAIAQEDNAPIPWDFIAVLVAGLLIVGVGLGLLLFINSPA